MTTLKEAAGDFLAQKRIAVAGVSFLRKGMKVRDLGDALGAATTTSRGNAT